jgi:PAS domain S-box-containing protein
VTLTYVVLGVLWILLSDWTLCLLLVDTQTAMRVELVKGWAFVAATALVLYAVVSGASRRVAAAHQALLEARAPYELMVKETIDYAIFMTDAQGQITSWNPGAERIYGFSTAEAVGMSMARLDPPEEAARLAECLAEVAAKGRCADEGWRVRKEGCQFWGAAVTTALRHPDQSVRGYARLVRDMTVQREAEERLRESEMRFRRLVEDAPVGILVHQDQRIAYANSQAAFLLGAWSPEEIVGTPTMDRIHEDSHPAVEARMAALAAGESSVPVIVEHWLRMDGESIYVTVGATGITFGGRPAIQLGLRDETARQNAEEALIEAYRSMERRVHERTAELERANTELQAFTYTVSHDLRAPVRHIDGFARLLEERENGAMSAEGKRLLTTIRQSAKRMGNLIDDLLRLSRLGRETLRPQEVDTEAMVRAVWSELGRGDESHTTLEVKPLPRSRADPGLLRQVWQNLLDNAIKYSGKRDDGRVTVEAHEEPDGLWYRVRDNGVGFDQRYADKLFGAFQRLHGGDEFQGTGVGLAIVKKVVELHGGKVRAHGEPGRGAEFEFTLGGGEGLHDR